MMIGAIALCLYSIAVCHLTKRYRFSASAATVMSLVAWLLIALVGKWLMLG